MIVKDGVKYATFNGKVSKMRHNFVQVESSDVADIPISTIAFEIGTGGKVTVNDKVEKVKDLKVGDQLTFWVREAQFGIWECSSLQSGVVTESEASSMSALSIASSR